MSIFEALTLVVMAVFGWLMFKIIDKLNRNSASDSPLIEWIKSTQAEVQRLQSSLTSTMQQSDKNVTDTLLKSYQALNERLDTASRVIGELKQETGKFSEIGRSMQSLQDFLNSPKLRGNIGEQILTDLMSQVLPKDSYETQYHFRSGDIVDAVIKTRAGIIAVDSKFPMENYSKSTQAESLKDQESYLKTFVLDVKKHIKAIASKYINTTEETVDFALMYIPAESIYYELTANQPEICRFAQESRVLLVSPSTFYAFLRTILVSFEGQRIAKEAQVILQQLRSIQKESVMFAGKLDTLSKHVTNAYNNMSSVSADFNQLQQKISLTNSLDSSNEKQLPL